MLNACAHAMYHYIHASGGARNSFFQLLRVKHCLDSDPNMLANMIRMLWPTLPWFP